MVETVRTNAMKHVSVVIKSREFVTKDVNQDGKEIFVKPVPLILSFVREYSEKLVLSLLNCNSCLVFVFFSDKN